MIEFSIKQSRNTKRWKAEGENENNKKATKSW
jgi:hypothetical protein